MTRFVSLKIDLALLARFFIFSTEAVFFIKFILVKFLL